VLSVNSMVALSSGAIGGIVLGWMADTAGVPVAMIAGAVALAAAAPLYVPAHRAERRERVRSRPQMGATVHSAEM
jgi:hypothetical protein